MNVEMVECEATLCAMLIQSGSVPRIIRQLKE